MPRTRISEYSTTNSDNTDIESINISEGCPPSGINNAIRELMVHLKEFQTGASGDSFTFAGAVTFSGNINSSGTNTFSGSNVISAAAGTSASPSIYFASDTNTGIFSPTADNVAVATGGSERVRVDSSGNVGIGVTPSAWASGIKALQNSARSCWYTNGTNTSIGLNVFNDGSANKYIATAAAALYEQSGAQHAWFTAPSGTAGNTITFTQAMTLDASGNLGIGITPSYRLDVSQAGATTISASFAMARITGGNATANDLVLVGPNTSQVRINFSDPDANGIGEIGYDHATNGMRFVTNNSERMRIDSSGNVGIGTTSPSAKLTVTSGESRIDIVATNASGRNWNLYSGGGGNVGSGAFAIAEGGSTQRFLIEGGGSGESARITSGGEVYVNATANVYAGAFQVNAIGTGAALTGKSSEWSVWTQYVWNATTANDSRFIAFGTEGTYTQRGDIDYNRTGGLVRYNTTSDATLKNILGDSDGQRSLEILNTTRLREYAWKDDPEQNKQVGVIAQELYETYKGAVSVGGDIERERDVTEEVEEEYTDEEGNTQTRTVTKVVGKETYTEYRPWGVDKTAFTFHLIAGWQAHEKKIAEQQAMIEALEARLSALEAK